MRKIFFSNPLFPPLRGGGAEHSLQELCTSLSLQSLSVQICALGSPNFSTPEHTPEGYVINWLRGPEHLSMLCNNEIEYYIASRRFTRDMAAELFRLVPIIRPDVLVANNAHCFGAVTSVSRAFGIPSVVIVRDPQPICAIGNCIEGCSPERASPCQGYIGTISCYLSFMKARQYFPPVRAFPGIVRDALRIGRRRYMQRKAMLQADAIVTISNALATMLRASDGMGDINSFVIPNLRTHVIPEKEADAVSFLEQYGLKSGQFILVAGKKSHGKGSDLLAPAMADVVACYPGLKLFAVGPGQVPKSDKNVIDGPDVQQSMLMSLLEKSKALLIPSRVQEGLHRTMIDAVFRGVPVVCTEAGGVSEGVYDGQNGYIVSSGRADLLAEAIIKVTAWDGFRREKCRCVAKRIFNEKFSDEVILKKWSNIFELLIAAG